MVAHRDISKEIAVAQLKFLVAPGRWAGDFASPGIVGGAPYWCRHTMEIVSVGGKCVIDTKARPVMNTAGISLKMVRLA